MPTSTGSCSNSTALPAYSIRYVPVVRSDGSGARLQLRGTAFLEVVVHAATADGDGRPVLVPSRLRPDFPALRDVDVPGSFEGQTTAGIGVSYRDPFRVLELTNPSRIVVDLAHPQIIDDGGFAGPRALTLTPAWSSTASRTQSFMSGTQAAPASQRS